MKIIVDTNVLISGIFFQGAPHRVLCALLSAKHELVLSPEIFTEYIQTAKTLSNEFPPVNIDKILDLLWREAVIVRP